MFLINRSVKLICRARQMKFFVDETLGKHVFIKLDDKEKV